MEKTEDNVYYKLRPDIQKAVDDFFDGLSDEEIEELLQQLEEEVQAISLKEGEANV